MRLEIPIFLPSVANLREHWAKKAKRAKAHRQAGWFVGRASKGKSRAKPTSIRLTRIAPRCLDDDNLASALKAFRDGVADGLGFKDDSKLQWKYQQEKGASAIRVEVFFEEKEWNA